MFFLQAMLYEPARRGDSRHAPPQNIALQLNALRKSWRNRVSKHCRTLLCTPVVFGHTDKMCGRYRLSRRKQILEEQFAAVSDDADWSPRYNIAPTQLVPVIRRNPKTANREFSLIRWGLVPSWAKDPSKGAAMINARSETAAIKPAFNDALKFRRCLIPADGFYEWRKIGTSKQPYCFEVNRGELFSFAGLWETWRDPSGNAVETCSILTTTANALAATVHNRMPVILDPQCYERWLDPGITDTSVVSEFLKPFDARFMSCFPISSRVNRPINDDAECSKPVEVIQPQGSLFS
jgi:putative SOS response-associated peptidase YedK